MPQHPRQGAILICVLACVSIAAALISLSLQTAVTVRRECKRGFHTHQLELLMDAGIRRAMRQLEQNSAYAGESWKIPELVLGHMRGRVDIEVADEVARSSTTGESPSEPCLATVKVTAFLTTQSVSSESLQNSYSFKMKRAFHEPENE